MKRKRGHKKGKSKSSTNPVALRNEEDQNNSEASGFDVGNDNKEDNSGMEVGTPSSTGTDQRSNLANVNPDGFGAKSIGRVKVKLRTPKVLDSQPNSSDAPSQSDTDRSSQQHGLERHSVNADRIEDSVSSLPHIKFGASSKKAGSIKIKSSKGLGLNSDQTSKPLPVSSETAVYLKERKAPPLNPRYHKQELDTSLMIIRKVMKMDAAEPFNVPVNPEALGIPDYFDIIDTPMDFGTICSNLEKNGKYMNSEDVYNDVKYIWENCYKYNNKGDYIVDLMRRVKKNFMKYWTAAGLYTEQPKGTKAEDIALSGDVKVGKGGQLKHKKKKRHGRHHKHDCLCAICVLKRRRKEREENDRIAKGNFGPGGDKHVREFKQEESMLGDSPGGEDSSSNTDESAGTDGEAGEDKGDVTKMQTSEKQRSPFEGRHEVNEVNDDDDDDDGDGMEEDDRGAENAEEEEDEEGEDEEEIEMDSEKRQMDGTLAEKSELGDTTSLHDEYKPQLEGQDAEFQQHKKHKEPQNRHQKAKLLESFCSENPMLSSLCGTLFPENSQSVWSGPHSLMRQRNSARSSSIHAAIRSFMK